MMHMNKYVFTFLLYYLPITVSPNYPLSMILAKYRNCILLIQSNQSNALKIVFSSITLSKNDQKYFIHTL